MNGLEIVFVVKTRTNRDITNISSERTEVRAIARLDSQGRRG